jgi:hypothetical protein
MGCLKARLYDRLSSCEALFLFEDGDLSDMISRLCKVEVLDC